MRIAGFAGAAAIVLTTFVTQSLANTPAVMAHAEEITQALSGKVCVTRAGATFMFSPDGRYEYEGLWKNGGQYEIGDGIVTVMFDSGLGRSFTISRHDKVFYMEETVLYCRQPAPPQSLYGAEGAMW